MKYLLQAMAKRVRSGLKFLLYRPVNWMADRFSAAPDQQKVSQSLTELYRQITREPGKKGLLIDFKPDNQPVILFSDHHKGRRNGSDDFAPAEKNYLAALDYYNSRKFYYINLGDSEELWENNLLQVLNHNAETFEAEKLFVDRKAFVKIAGNHDLFWKNDPFAPLVLRRIYGQPVRVYMGVVLRAELPYGFLDIFCTHGHQGDRQSDGNAFSKWFVTYIWGPLQAFLDINTNSPSKNNDLKTLHNQFMYDWSRQQQDLVLITGHTHQPVFKSLTHLERLYRDRETALKENNTEWLARIDKEIPKRKNQYDHINQAYQAMRPGYFNTGCCCFDGGTITGIEIAEGAIRLVKWSYENGVPARTVAEEVSIVELSRKMGYL
jgi:predicted phosphodiesterase